MRRMLSMVAVLGLLAAGCGGAGDPTDAGPVPGRAPESETTLDPAATSTTSAPGPTSPEAPTTAPSGTTQVAVWLVRGEILESATRTVPRVPGIGAEAVKALLAGPTPAETRSGFSTAVPTGTRFLRLVIDADGIAKVDLSRDFESGGGSLGLTLRLGQVACTVSQFPTVKGVRFALAGELVSVFSGNGIVLDKPVTCDSYREVMGQPGNAATFAGIWPFATRAELDAYAAGPDRTYRDPVATAREFATKYVGMDNPVDFPSRTTGSGTVEVPIGPRYGEGRTTLANPQATYGVVVRQLGAQGASGPWTVVEATAFEISVSTPKPLDKVASPVRLAGQARAFEGTVQVQVREDGMIAGQALGRGVVTGGGDVKRPYSGDITFRSPTKPAGAIVLVEMSVADGQGILRATVVRVRF
ncbi:MAG: GerMN domain-containing protein [Acidimicrobiales bacterium]